MVLCTVVDPAEREHGGRESTLSRAESESFEGESCLTGAEPGAP